MAECNHGRGLLRIVGTGPGDKKHLTPAAAAAIEDAAVVVGYKTYLDLIAGLLDGKEVMASSMMKEVDRCRKALELALDKDVALVCGGDPGIYAMAGLVFELARKMETPPKIEVIPGIAAVNACAARLGAPLMHDFAVISLSDLLTPWDLIEKRLNAAAAADFVIAIYNPRSKKRDWQLPRAREIILAHRGPETPVGIVTAASRREEKIIVSTLSEMPISEVGMQSTLIIGNSRTFIWDERIITPRGYGEKYQM
jgi:precorrin-3B C17-methyltransferase